LSSSVRSREIWSWIVLNAVWVPLSFQDAALMTIAVPAALLQLAPATHVVALSALSSLSAIGAMLVPPLAGLLSDRVRRNGGGRLVFVAVGLAIDVGALVALSFAQSLVVFGILLVLAIAGANVALAAYQALLPELVPRAKWGVVSGIRGALTLIGTVLGLAIAGTVPTPGLTFIGAAVIITVCAASLFWIRENKWEEPDHAHVRDWHDFFVVFVARILVFFGLILLQTYVYYYFRDIQGLANPSGGTALAAGCTMLGATGSSVYLGILSDRAPRKIITAIAGLPMAMAAIGFAIAPAPQWIFLYAFLFGVGFGGVLSTGWALAMDSIPAMTDVARDLGLWGIATNLPNVVAPLIGGWLIASFGGQRAGYQAVFGLAGCSFALASLAVLRVGRDPLSSMFALPLRFGAITSNYVFGRLAYRIRHWGNVPRKRGATLLVANHQHDLESETIVSTTTVLSGPWRHPFFTASSRRMYEPGFMAIRIPWLRPLLRSVNFGWLFVSIGMLPLENQLSSRPIAAFAHSVQRRHGPKALADVFDERTSALFPPGTTTADLWREEHFDISQQFVKVATLQQPFKREILDETRASIEADLALMEKIVREGGSFYLTPEGNYSTDGRIGPMRGAIDRLAPHCTIYLAGVSYDPFVSKKLSMLYRVARLDDREHLTQCLAALRPVVASQLLAAWLDGRTEPFDETQAVDAVAERLKHLPEGLFVDPELQRDPAALVRAALPLMVEWNILERGPLGYRLAPTRRHPQFPLVGDIIAYNARFLEETIDNAAYRSDVVR
jgi:MFS family permease